MNSNSKATVVLVGFTVGFLVLQAAFLGDWWGKPRPLHEIAAVPPQFTNTATVRVSAKQLLASGGDTSGQDCYACHEKGKTPQVHIDKQGKVKLPSEHEDLVVHHGRNDRNNHCFNCHDPNNLDHFVTKNGSYLKLQEGTLLCASCHGPTFRDWEVGVHGRMSGFWNKANGDVTRQDCTSCHDPHAPAFPPVKPAPGPHPLRAEAVHVHSPDTKD